MRSLFHSPFHIVVVAVLLVAAPVAAPAQSLDVHHPAALVAGVNTGTVDSMVGPQFWEFHALKGSVAITIQFASMGLLGNASTATIQVVLHDTDGKVFGSQTLVSNGKPAQLRWPGTFGKPTTAIIEIRPAGNSLVRTGGDYSIAVSGAVSYAGAKPAGPERVAGTYQLMTCQPTFDCQTVRFLPNGVVRAADGSSGSWTIFDPDALIYTVKIDQAMFTVKLAPGRGLMSTSDASIVVFQAIR
jgi:hypothetical protein